MAPVREFLVSSITEILHIPCGKFVDDFFGIDPLGVKLTGGYCISVVSDLVNVPMDTKKDVDDQQTMVLLGMEVAVKAEEREVLTCVDEEKAIDSGIDLDEVVTSGILPPWRAAKFPGRFSFALTYNADKIGRAFIRPLHAQTHSPIPGDRLSAAGARSCRWFGAYLRLRPVAVHSAIREKRRHVHIWSDAAGVNRTVAAFSWCTLYGWRWTSWRTPQSLWDRLLPRQDEQIGYQEFAGVVLALCTFGQQLAGQCWTAWIDNQGVLLALLKGGARSADLCAGIGQFWIDTAKLRIALQCGRVCSAANIADEPTRGEYKWVQKVQAVFVEPIVPEWLRDPWLCPDVPPTRFS